MILSIVCHLPCLKLIKTINTDLCDCLAIVEYVNLFLPLYTVLLPKLLLDN